MTYEEIARWGGWLVAAILLLPRLWSALRAIGEVPRAVGEDLDEFAQQRVENRRRDSAIAKLAEKADEILFQLAPNGGKSMADKVERLAQNVEAHILDSAADSALLRSHVRETAPLVAQYQRDLAAREGAQ